MFEDNEGGYSDRREPCVLFQLQAHRCRAPFFEGASGWRWGKEVDTPFQLHHFSTPTLKWMMSCGGGVLETGFVLFIYWDCLIVLGYGLIFEGDLNGNGEKGFSMLTDGNNADWCLEIYSIFERFENWVIFH